MSWIAVGAIAVGTAAGGYMSSEASKDAAAAGQKGAERASGITQAAADRARRDVMNLFPSAQKDLLAGYSGAYDLLGQGIGEQQRLLQEGNLAAQGTTAGGFDQVRAALMGLPVDTQGFAPQGIQASQAPVNPMMGLGGQSPMFSNIGQQQQARQQSALEGIQTNRDLIAAIGSGDLEGQGLDTDYWRGVTQGSRGKKGKWFDKKSNFFDQSSLLTATTPEQQQQIVASSGLNKDGRMKLAALMSEYQKLRGQQ